MRTTHLDYADLIGAPYAEREWGPGYDCFTIVAEVYRRLALDYVLPLDLETSITSSREIMLSMLDRKHWTRVLLCSRVGDIALVRGAGDETSKVAKHCAVMVAPGLMLHATSKVGVATIPYRSIRPFTIQNIRAAVVE